MADGTLAGTVRDLRNMQPIGSASITGTQGTAQVFKVPSGGDGSWSASVPEGVYDLVVQAAGYDAGNYQGIHVFAGVTTTLPFVLHPADF